jgi:hypothetical protein
MHLFNVLNSLVIVLRYRGAVSKKRHKVTRIENAMTFYTNASVAVTAYLIINLLLL